MGYRVWGTRYTTHHTPYPKPNPQPLLPFPFTRSPDLNAEPIEIEVFSLIDFSWSAAIDCQPQIGPETRSLSLHVEAGGINVCFDEPAPGSPLVFTDVACLFLPPLQDPGQVLARHFPTLLFRNVKPHFLGCCLHRSIGNALEGLEQLVLQKRTAPGRPQVKRDSSRFHLQSVKVDFHTENSSPVQNRNCVIKLQSKSTTIWRL